MTTLRNVRLRRNRGSVPGRAKRIPSSPKHLDRKGSQASSYCMVIGGPFSARHSGRGVKLIAHLHLVPSLRTSGATPPLRHMALSLKRDIFSFKFTVTVFNIIQPSLPTSLISCFALRFPNRNLFVVFFPFIRTVLESSWNVMAHGDAQEGKWRGNWLMKWVASTLYTTSEHGVSSITTADTHTSAASSRLNWRPRRINP